MENLFELMFTLVLTLWENVSTIFSPIINFITTASGVLIPVLAKFLNFIISILDPIMNAIQGIIDFFS